MSGRTRIRARSVPAGLLMRMGAVLACAMLISACVTSGGIAPREHPRPAAEVVASQSLAGAAVRSDPWPPYDWWVAFGDPQLDRLMSEALAGSPTLQVAAARTRIALAEVQASGAERYPQVAADGSSMRELLPGHSLVPPPYAGHWSTLNELALNLSWELDFWGKNRSAYAQALGAARASGLDEQAARLSLAASIAHAYVELQRAYLQLDVAQTELSERERIYALTRDRSAAGIDSRLELKQAESTLPDAHEQITRLEERIELTRHQLATLAGDGPDRGLTLTRPAGAALPQLSLPSRLPAELLGHRPDILALRWRIEAARSGIDNAKARFYPDVDLRALIGLQALGPVAFATAANREIGIGPALTLPIFDAGQRRATLAGRDAQYDLVVAQYNQALADALREVVDQLSSFASVTQQRSEQRAALATAQDAYDLALLRYREGLGNYLQVLSTHAQLLAQRSLDADLTARALDVSIDLARALGGGFQPRAASEASAPHRIWE